MHDFYLANQILKTVLEYAQKNGFANVSRIRLELGSIIEHDEEISPENLIYNFKLLSKNTIAKNAKLEIKKITCLPAGRKENYWRLLDIEGN